MKRWLRTNLGWWLAWLLLAGLGSAWLARAELQRMREDFDANGRIVHRLMSQQAVQYDAVLATLALLEPLPGVRRPERLLPTVYPSILAVQRRDPGHSWDDPAMAAAEARSRALHRAEWVAGDFAGGRYGLVIGAEPIAYALDIDLARAIPWGDWPMDPHTSAIRVALEQAGRQFVVQPGDSTTAGGWRFEYRKTLDADSQPFDLVAGRRVSWLELPWGRMVAWSLAMAVVLGAAWVLKRQRVERRRAEQLLRLGQVGRLNALGELAAGMAHELNQPLTAVLANTQAAQRLLNQEPPELATARGAMRQAAEQARRASEVVGRMRRAVERPDRAAQRRPVVLQQALRSALHLLAPELARRAVTPSFDEADPAPVTVQAEPVAVEQIIHNLLMNALQALEHVPAAERRLRLGVGLDGGQGVLSVTDNGIGLSPEALKRVFEPFFSLRDGGLGLGLSLSETLATGMGGSLAADHASPRGARFVLRLPLVGVQEGGR